MMYSEKKVDSTGDLSLLVDWTSDKVAAALHSENQDVIIDTLNERFRFDENLDWKLMRRLCIPVWLKDINKLK